MEKEAYCRLTEEKIGALKGIGVKRAEAFSRLGLDTVGELLHHFPRVYQNRGHISPLSLAPEGENASFLLTVGTQPKTVTLKNRMTITKFAAFDGSGTVVITYFNSRFLEKVFAVGQEFRFWGKVKREKGRLTMAAPIHEPVSEKLPLPDFVPVYPSGAGLTQKLIADTVGEALSLLEKTDLPEVLPESFRVGLGLPEAKTAYRAIHCPQTLAEIEGARRYFSAEELYLFSLGLALTKNRKRSGVPPVMRDLSLTPLLSRLGFPLTGAQKRSVEEIRGDMVNAEVPMSRLLSGDVGSGKTAVAAAAAFLAVGNRYQVALMAPTEILASQHYDSLAPLFSSLGFRVGLLIGSTPLPEKRRLKEALADGSLDLLIGTHALISSGVSFARLGLVITDEQHRFGVAQRASLGKDNRGGGVPHVLVMSATPIPRTLALILYGELSLSMLDELPPGRQKVDTFVVDESYRARLNRFIASQVREGGQVYLVCPAVEEKEEEEWEGDLIGFAPDGSTEFHYARPKKKTAVEYYEELKKNIFPEFSVGLIHGRMKGCDKEEVMRRFSAGEIQILVSTTVIEVGVNVPNASLMVVENAECFGLSQLHQLRGRVGRGKRKAYCVLVSSTDGEKAMKRLKVMRTTDNGYKIAEYDLELRGPGDYFPSEEGKARQHGSFSGRLNTDMALFKRAMEEAEKTLAADPELKKEENLAAARGVRQLFETDERAMQ